MSQPRNKSSHEAPDPTELDRLRERVEALENLEREAAKARERVSNYSPEKRAELLREAKEVQAGHPLPTDPADWEPCEWDGKTFPVYMRDRDSGNFVEKFLDVENSVLVAENNVNFLGRKYKWTGFKADSENWTPVRPKRRKPEPDPLSDEALKSWFWENARRVDVRNLGSYLMLNWLKPDCSTPTGITVNADAFIDALRSLRKQVMERENGGAE